MTRTTTALPLAALLALPVTVHAADAGTWTGPYGGVNVTVVGVKSTATGSNAYTTTTNDGGEGDTHAAHVHTSSLAHTNDGEEGSTTVLNTEPISNQHQTTIGGAGVRLGYNYQTGPIVLGVEADGNIFNFTLASGAQGTGPTGPNEGYSVTTHATLVGTVRARAGLAFDRVLLFGTGGVAFTNLRSTLITNSGFVDSKNQTTGWAAGGGAEFKLTRKFSFAATVLYNQFGTTQLSGGDGTSGFAAGVKTHYITGAVGINMHF